MSSLNDSSLEFESIRRRRRQTDFAVGDTCKEFLIPTYTEVNDGPGLWRRFRGKIASRIRISVQSVTFLVNSQCVVFSILTHVIFQIDAPEFVKEVCRASTNFPRQKRLYLDVKVHLKK